jgi:hypothetical protein
MDISSPAAKSPVLVVPKVPEPILTSPPVSARRVRVKVWPVARQFAVRLTLFEGIVKLVVGWLAFARVTPPELTVQPVKVKPGLVPARMVTVEPGA